MLEAKKIRPKGRMCLVRRMDAAQRRTKGGIILPDTAKDGNEMAEVLAVGPGIVNEETGKRIDPDVKPGEFVLVPQHSMHPNAQISVGGEKLFLIPAPEILADVEPEPERMSIGGAVAVVGKGR